MTDKQINKFSDLTFTQLLGYDLVATFNNNKKIKELQEQLKRKEQECEELKKINKANAKTYEKQWYELAKHKQTITEIKDCFEYYEKEQDYLSFVSELNKILRKVSEVVDEQRT